MDCADIGNNLGYKTYVLQGGEDPYFTDERMVEIITAIKKRHPNNAITLSLGERSYESYKIMFEAGADRYYVMKLQVKIYMKAFIQKLVLKKEGNVFIIYEK